MTDQIHLPLRQFRFQLTREDYAAFEWLPRELVGLQRLWFYGPVLACGAAAGFFEDALRPYLPFDPETRMGQILLVLPFLAIGYGLSLILLTARARHRIGTALIPATPTAIDTYGDHFTVTQDGVTTCFAWEMVRVVANDSHVFLCPTPRVAIILPLRAFEYKSDMTSFALWAKNVGDDEDRSRAHPAAGANA